MILKYAYTVFIGVLLATFVGVGIAAFYSSPKSPEPPVSARIYDPQNEAKDATLSAQRVKDSEELDKQYQEFRKQSQNYNRNVSIIALVASLLILAISLTILSGMPVIADGLLLGSVLTLLYSIVRGFESEDSKFRFAVVSVGLVVSLFLGYLKFSKDKKF